MAFFFPMCVFSSVLELPQLKSAVLAARRWINDSFSTSPWGWLHKMGLRGQCRKRDTDLWFSETPATPYNLTTANSDIPLQSSLQFYLGILKYFVNLVIMFASQNQSSTLVFPGGYTEASWVNCLR